MQFLKTLVLIMLVVVFIVFAYINWQAVTVDLWGGLQLVTKLPVLLVFTFLAGFLPLWTYHRTTSWRMKRRIATLEANQTRTAMATSAPAPLPVQTPSEAPANSINDQEPESALRSV
jgi:lipopolysaccharide assembly protein A